MLKICFFVIDVALTYFLFVTDEIIGDSVFMLRILDFWDFFLSKLCSDKIEKIEFFYSSAKTDLFAVFFLMNFKLKSFDFSLKETTCRINY